MSKVIIVGCGITGPVIACLLQKKGYKVVIVEKVSRSGDVGSTLALQPNGLKVLATLGLAEGITPFGRLFEWTSKGECLAQFDLASAQRKYGFEGGAVRRSVLLKRLRSNAVQQGVELHDGFELDKIQQTEDGVIAISKDGQQIAGSFLVGCDGLHSATRRWVLKWHGLHEIQAHDTGLVQCGGLSPIPEGGIPGVHNWYGDGKHVVTYSIDEKYSVWAMTVPKMHGTEKEMWGLVNDLEEQKAELLRDFADWPKPVRQLIAGTEKLGKIGLYDRPELSPEHWYHGRCVLVGDAAHPTSPHLGQGANLGMEDCWHLNEMLPNAGEDLQLSFSFQRYAEKRQPRTAVMVKAARAQGELRAASGVEACKERNEKLRQKWSDQEGIQAMFDFIYQEPFEWPLLDS